jgi:hypothetical protein
MVPLISTGPWASQKTGLWRSFEESFRTTPLPIWMDVKWKMLLAAGLSGGVKAAGSKRVVPGVVKKRAPSAPVEPEFEYWEWAGVRAARSKRVSNVGRFIWWLPCGFYETTGGSGREGDGGAAGGLGQGSLKACGTGNGHVWAVLRVNDDVGNGSHRYVLGLNVDGHGAG